MCNASRLRRFDASISKVRYVGSAFIESLLTHQGLPAHLLFDLDPNVFVSSVFT